MEDYGRIRSLDAGSKGMTITQWLRSRCLRGVHDVKEPCTKTLEELRKSEWCTEFEQLMRNRLLMGCFRYGAMDDPAKGKFEHVWNMIHRLRLYQKTGNKEHLVDVANLALIEFVHPAHPNAHFEASDDGIHCKPLD